MSKERAVRFAGIDRATLWRWEQKGRAGEPGYAEFVEELDRAEAEFEAEMSPSSSTRRGPDDRAHGRRP
jgi:hypothetical protein